ncbi:MAG TPA: class I SAM-dependent methyltransferase [Puia sp.]|nr:class I SAM-dependent methyltransferase [Puia sp.]
MNIQDHWDKIYHNKASDELSWTQEVPRTSLGFIDAFKLSADARIIDIGGGESRLVDFLLEKGYRNITVLDISREALRRAQERLGEKAALVKWVVADVANFIPEDSYDVWHDRATFHFLTRGEEIARYLLQARNALPAGGYFVIGTFSHNGPEKCSGLPVHQYSEQELTRELSQGFNKIRCITEDHRTPFQTVQNFLFCSFRRA